MAPILEGKLIGSDQKTKRKTFHLENQESN
jgi:hypothetical protein